eukprot:gnl/MRDRNA2_/MRDRNA2_121921_c0_seq1.p1 gnl/MRDRNA2_/MRDRNA2_121921_c0~~gnl/MRDRNA2_/MRDRNA2_121921_c0_seq1.p1  ORF type:complete len:448 (-),score=99.01 gnl/MRDRNA2_/MRDRNA2_121921_c0_seq1:281-1537(-)
MESAIIKLQHRKMDDVQAAIASVLVERGGVPVKAIWLDGNDLSLNGFEFFLPILDSPNLKALTLSSERSMNLDEMRGATHFRLCGESCAYEYQIRDPEMLVITALVRTSTCLEVLDLRENEITDRSIERLVKAMQACQTLKSIDLRRNRLSVDGRKKLYRSLSLASHVKELYVKPQKDDTGFEQDDFDDDEDDMSPVKSKRGELDFETVKSGSNVELINLKETLDMTLICELLTDNLNVQAFVVENNNIGDSGASELAENWLKWTQAASLLKLHLSHCKLGDAGMTSLTQALSENTDMQLQELCLWSNQIGDDGAVALAAWLRTNDSLEELQLYDNQIGDVGCAALCDALDGHPSILRLALGRNRLTEVALEGVVNLLSENPELEVMLDDDDFSADVKQKVWMQSQALGGDAIGRLQF